MTKREARRLAAIQAHSLIYYSKRVRMDSTGKRLSDVERDEVDDAKGELLAWLEARMARLVKRA